MPFQSLPTLLWHSSRGVKSANLTRGPARPSPRSSLSAPFGALPGSAPAAPPADSSVSGGQAFSDSSASHTPSLLVSVTAAGPPFSSGPAQALRGEHGSCSNPPAPGMRWLFVRCRCLPRGRCSRHFPG